jgi:hypothetical protein
MKKAFLLIIAFAGFLHASVYLDSRVLFMLLTEPILNLNIDKTIVHNGALVVSPEITWAHYLTEDGSWTAASLGIGYRQYFTFKDGQMISDHLTENSFSMFSGIHVYPSHLYVSRSHKDYSSIAPELRTGTLMVLNTMMFQVSLGIGYNFTDYSGSHPWDTFTPNTAFAQGFYYRINFCIGGGDF